MGGIFSRRNKKYADANGIKPKMIASTQDHNISQHYESDVSWYYSYRIPTSPDRFINNAIHNSVNTLQNQYASVPTGSPVNNLPRTSQNNKQFLSAIPSKKSTLLSSASEGLATTAAAMDDIKFNAYTNSICGQLAKISVVPTHKTFGHQLTLSRSTTQLMAHFKNQTYKVNFLDLFDDEYEHLLKNLLTKIVIEDENNIFIKGNVLNLQRLMVPLNTSPVDFKSMETKSQTQTIFFSYANNTTLIAKYQDNYYFVLKQLTTEYMDLLKATGLPVGTAMRLNTNRIVVNKNKNTINVNQTVKFNDNENIFVIDSFVNSDVTWIDQMVKQTKLHRYFHQPFKDNQSPLLLLNAKLVYASIGSVDEIFAELDILVSNEKIEECLLVIEQIICKQFT